MTRLGHFFVPEKLEKALMERGDGRPYFNGAEFSLTDASYAPALMRFTFFDRIHPLGLIEEFPFVAAWRDALMARPSVLAAVPIAIRKIVEMDNTDSISKESHAVEAGD